MSKNEKEIGLTSPPDFADYSVDDDDVNAMFEKYLGNMDPSQLKVLLEADNKKANVALERLGRGGDDSDDDDTSSRANTKALPARRKNVNKTDKTAPKPTKRSLSKPSVPAQQVPAKAPLVSSSGKSTSTVARPSLLPTKKLTKVPTIAPPSASPATSQVVTLHSPNTRPNSQPTQLNDKAEEDTDLKSTEVTSPLSVKEPFRYEATINLSSNQRATNAKVFDFQTLVGSILSPEERMINVTAEQISEALALTKFVDLSGKGLKESDDLMCLDSVTHLYLQHNLLTEIGGLSALPMLTVLSISHNVIESLAPLAVLDHLKFLDASHNKVLELDVESHLPSGSLIDLRLTGNPCAPDYAFLQAFEVEGKDEIDADTQEQLDYLDQYRAEILTFCPLLRFLDEYEVASFAPEHIIVAEETATNPRMLADTLRDADQAGIDNAAVLINAEEEIDKAMLEDMDYDRDEEVLSGETIHNAAEAFITQPRPASSTGLSEIQMQLMEAYLGHDGTPSVSAASIRPGTASTRPNTATLRPGSAAAAATVAALDGIVNKKVDSSSSSSSDDDDPLIGKNHKGRKKSGRIGGSQMQAPSDIAEDKGYAKLSERQKEIAKELSIAQRHREQVAKLQLMETWDTAAQSVRDLRIASENRRRQLILGSLATPLGSVDGLVSSTSSSGKGVGGALAIARDTQASNGEEISHSAAYLKAMEQLRKDVGGYLDVSKYRKAPN